MYLLGRNSSVIFSAITIAASSSMKTIENASLMNSLKPPASVTEEERIAWFRKKLPEFKIFKSNNLTEKFHGRVLEFFGEECEIRAFMTSISPARSFGKREVLSLETFFKAHPHGCLMILSRTLDSRHGYRVLKPLLDRQVKLAAVTPGLSFLFKNTPVESWFDSIKSGNKDPGEIPLAQNLSNLIRLAVLYKYGGVYLDTDFIILKSLKGLKNSIGAQSTDVVSGNWTRLNNAVLIFDMNHPLLLKFIEEFATTFDVLPPSAFYPVHWNNIGGLFKLPENRAGLRWVKAKLLQLSGQTYGITKIFFCMLEFVLITDPEKNPICLIDSQGS
ncbi:hypothetical protein EZV62_016667 [Acer yangbiense]|uniref:Alpha 1,4-glycosyltransferase domain-containing protein n=1 Tax=Acer yangbiense TaxID=1000413 RepID=A0A5C7HPW8_9ROSI|nr:hypothetical protein EZV62_016667 [Acer yangbiense]